MQRQLKAYLAGPDVFLPDAVEIGRRKRALCAEHGIVGLFPLDNEVSGVGTPRDLALTISRLNEAMIDSCDIVLANLTPFRSPSLDPGTAFEIGYARAAGKTIHGYSAAAGTLLERTRAVFRLDLDTLRDRDGSSIENFGLVDNLMIDGAIDANGGFISVVPEPSLAAFKAFEDLLSRLAMRRLEDAAPRQRATKA
ncbi:MAG TPA: nucleoside 2-deoxyribosyltransferase [Rhizomicrobium sp.]|nr:nucleoside 2-deoxyribosyltransferase [Rhizomicrobium sp.]